MNTKGNNIFKSSPELSFLNSFFFGESVNIGYFLHETFDGKNVHATCQLHQLFWQQTFLQKKVSLSCFILQNFNAFKW